MQANNQLTVLFNNYAKRERPPVIMLKNIGREPVAAIYLSTIQCKNLVVSETNNTEKYYLYIDGIGIYFSSFEILKK